MANKVTEYIFCPYCGGITPSKGACVNCGFDVNEQNLQENAENDPQQGNPYIVSQAEPQMNRQGNPYISAANMQQRKPAVNPMKEKKKSHWWIWLLVGIGCFLILILLIVIVVLFIFVANYSTNAFSSLNTGSSTAIPYSYTGGSTYEYTSESELGNDDVLPREIKRESLGDYEWTLYGETADVYSDTTTPSDDVYLQSGYEGSFSSDHTNVPRDTFTGPYFEPFVESIDETQPYTLERHFINYEKTIQGILVAGNIAYYQILGDIPNVDEINDTIFEYTAYDLINYLKTGNSVATPYSSIAFLSDSYVTYNDGKILSILLDVNVVVDGSVESYVYAINVDLVNGCVLDNSTIVNVDEDFAAMFRSCCITQNGADITALNAIDDTKLAELLANPETNIVFYSPLGLEIGFMYSANGYSGWMTITVQEYEQYLQNPDGAPDVNLDETTTEGTNEQNGEENNEASSENSEVTSEELEDEFFQGGELQTL